MESNVMLNKKIEYYCYLQHFVNIFITFIYFIIFSKTVIINIKYTIFIVKKWIY
jgi:hypothetical protein